MSLIGRFMTGTYTVERHSAGRYVKGIWTQGPMEKIQVRGSLQPAHARELNIAEEGTRLKQYWKFYTDAPILVIGTKILKSADTVIVNGETYKVLSVEIWKHTDLDYYKSILAREPENP